MTFPAFFIRMWASPGRRFAFLLAMGGALLLLADVIAVELPNSPTGSLRLELRSETSSVLLVRYDIGTGFAEDESVSRRVLAGQQSQVFLVPLPQERVRKLRIDFLQPSGIINLHSISVVRDSDGSEVQAFELESLTNGAGFSSLVPDEEGLTIRPLAGTGAVQVQVPLPRAIRVSPSLWQCVSWLLVIDIAIFVSFAASLYLAAFGWPQRLGRVFSRGRIWRLTLRWFPDRWAVLLFALPVVCTVCWLAATQRSSYYLEAEVLSDRATVSRFHFDAGDGFRDTDTIRERIPESASFRKVRFPIPVTRITGLHFDPSNGPARMRVNSLAIRSDAEDWLGSEALYSLDLRNLWPLQQMTELVHEDNGSIRLLVVEGHNEPSTRLDLGQTLTLGLNVPYVALRTLVWFGIWFAVWVVALEFCSRWPAGTFWRLTGGLRRMWGSLSPAQAIWLVAACSVVASSYPVIFCGKSFAAVNFKEEPTLLYQRVPTLPGTTVTRLESSHGSDLSAMALRAVPAGVLETRALFHDRQLPLRNRYDGLGVPFYGQGESMLGDPLQWLVIGASGHAWGWDLKFLTAKWLFAAGIGLLILAATESTFAALLLSFSAAFIGFWAFRLNHPAYFSLCYAPWILLAWIHLARSREWRSLLGWTLALILANWMELHSGSLSEAFVCLLYFNATGLILIVLRREPIAPKFQRLLAAGAGGLLLFVLSGPWLTAVFDAFSHTVGGERPEVGHPLAAGLFVGLFDDIFFRQIVPHKGAYAPSTNCLVLAGGALALSAGKRLLRNEVFVATLIASLCLVIASFAVVPRDWSGMMPLAGEIAHPESAFATGLCVASFVLAGFGLKQCRQGSRARWSRDVLFAGILIAGLLVSYFRLLDSLVPAGQSAIEQQAEFPILFSAFFQSYVPVLVISIILIPFALRRLLIGGPQAAPTLLLALCLFIIHWRQGLQLPGEFARYTPALADRVDLRAPSPAVSFLLAAKEPPFRTVGFGANLAPGYAVIAGLETMNSPRGYLSPYVAELQQAGMKLNHDWLKDSLDLNRLAEVKKLYDAVNIRYFLTLPGENLSSIGGLELVQHLDLNVYRNEAAWPRAFFVDRLEEYNGVLDYLREVAEGDGKPFAAIDVNEYPLEPRVAGVLLQQQAGRKVVPASHYRRLTNATYFDLDVPKAGVIVLSEAYYPGSLSAFLNGHVAGVFRVNHAFTGLLVDRPGHYRVVVRFWPPHFTLAICGAVVGWIIMAAGIWLLWYTRRCRSNLSPVR